MRTERSTAPFWLPLAPMIFATVYLALHWSAIPPRWVSHWGRGGIPNGWSTKSITGVFGPFLIAFVLLAVFEGIGALVRLQSRDKNGGEALGDAVTSLIRFILTAAIGLISWLAAALPFGVEEPTRIIFIGLAAIILAILFGAVRVVNATKSFANVRKLPGYENGLYYKNRDDPRLWVPKIIGIGTTLNFAHPWAWPVFLALTLGPIAVAIIALLALKP